MTDHGHEGLDGRVLLLTPTGRDADLTGRYLTAAGIPVEVCAGIEELCEKCRRGAGAALIAEEALTSENSRRLLDALGQQPAWSDFPLVVLTAGGQRASGDASAVRSLGDAANVTLVERPTRVITILSAVRSALRARRRQYEVRAHLAAERLAQEERARLLDEAVAARAEAEAVNRAKDVFLATLSHELRTPLTAILGWVRILHDKSADAEISRHGLEVIERNAEAQYQLIRDLLDVSRIISGKLQLNTRQIGLAPVVEAALDSVRQAADAKSIRLGAEYDDETDLVTGDPDRLQQVIWNLLSNAIKFTPKGGSVGVRVGRHGSDVRVSVSDTGQGISPEFLPHVFERFRQADGSTTREHGGLGLGLAIVRHLVEQHGGRVSAESDGEQRGSTFSIDLPIAAVKTPAREAEGRPDSKRPPAGAALALGGVRVLVVDDNPDARELLTLVLGGAGAEVTAAASAAAALELLQQAEVDVLISDIGMPTEDGYALIGQARSLTARRTPSVALTAYASEEDRRRALAAGFDAHITKPVEPAELVSVLAGLVASPRRDACPSD
ncbi:MAG TPA: hybrid sensor histidine kinase/response regulator [Pyrinomonadaceae bacterium]|nr:hybrid sensor histidine kinase/response regulator [Pyrinomonadaceae bacterium]